MSENNSGATAGVGGLFLSGGSANAAIYGSNGVKLVSKGSQVSQQQFARLAQHRLTVPLDKALASEHALWEEAVTLDPGDDPALRSLHEEGVKSLPWTALLRRVLAVATSPR